ncbi:dTMP kinase [Methanococcus maripaludis]|uniref:Probable thymidylate kinase n=1 Tax=Methanococcus maripaludis TaxID=39152 RepID=A0A7J9NH61_METMI|nr:dTMP kinase [Methanococcus maripaludis]MBA2840185.1 dTMP kinase [Methanococcus maripaludis]MBA2852792.1 dTMP kinase [Methanococcus maripaludis]MBA2868538.1 dTMP kinase [Methanococcus maripaludis]MBB6400858.1 dTMP kinase [Methanococcus maripaludis]
MNKFIVFEGIDGCGKTTQAKLIAEKLNANFTFEPTDGKIGKSIREILAGSKCNKETLALLFAADRVEHVSKIEEDLKNSHVVSDRYVYSSIVYQMTQGIPKDFIYKINDYAKIPDLVVLLDVDLNEALKRMESREKEIFEKLEFQKKIKEEYYNLINSENEKFMPKHGFIVIDTTSKPINQVFNEILNAIVDKIPDIIQ